MNQVLPMWLTDIFFKEWPPKKPTTLENDMLVDCKLYASREKQGLGHELLTADTKQGVLTPYGCLGDE